jgi:phospholipid/cholesterol/gamma-HCH transport system ATP-binding protein
VNTPSHTPSAASRATSTEAALEPAIIVEHVSFAFDDHVVLRDISFEVGRGTMKMLLGASGSGKSVLLKLILGLMRPDSGTIRVNGERIDNMPERELLRVRADIGMAFQENALFDSLTVAENVGYRLMEETRTPLDDVRRRVEDLLAIVGLAEFIDRMPAQLSGGQRRRVAIARALASEPSVILLDDPTTGLDPIISATVDDAIITLRDVKAVTSVLATHQIRDAVRIATHRCLVTPQGSHIVAVDDATAAAQASFIVLHEGGIRFEGTHAELLASDDAYLCDFIRGTLPPW